MFVTYVPRDPKSFYVYVLFRDNSEPFYVGKGRGLRWLWHEKSAREGGDTHKDRLIRQILSRRADVPKVKVREGLTNDEARELEVALIAAIGREPRGPLINKTRGGDGCVEPSDDVRIAMGAANKGRKLSAETRAKMSASKKGFKITAEARAIGAAKRIGLKRTEETKAKMRAAKLGRKLTLAHVAKIAAKNRGKVQSPEARAKISAARLANPNISDIVKNSWRPDGPRRTKLKEFAE